MKSKNNRAGNYLPIRWKPGCFFSIQMKKIIFLFTVIAIGTLSYSQNVPQIESKEKAMEILKSSDFFYILRFPSDTLFNIDRFIGELKRILPMDQIKENQLKEEILSVIRKKEGFSQHWSLLFWPVGHEPMFGTNIKSVLKENFSGSEYDNIINQTSNDLKTAYAAYRYLVLLKREERLKENNEIIFGFSDSVEYLKKVYEYFGI